MAMAAIAVSYMAAMAPLFHQFGSLPPLQAATLSSSKQGRARMIAEVAAEAPAWYAAGLFVDPRVEGILSFPLVAKDLVLLYMYGHVPIVMYLLLYQAKNGSLCAELQAERLASVAVAAHDGEAEERETGFSGHSRFRLRARLGVVLLYVDRRSWHLRAHVCWDREARRW